MTTKILLDTDIGSDIDDAICLAYLLANPECDLLGITTVTGEPNTRAMIASAICKAAGRDIPIYPGIERPMLIRPQQPRAQQAPALKKWAHDKEFPQGQAIQFLRNTIYQHPHEIVLLTIGPLTNIAVLFTLDPEIPALLKGLVMMCGLFTKRLGRVAPLEWNAQIDPHATAIVYRHDVAYHHSISADVTNEVRLSADEFRARCQAGILQPVLDFAEYWFQGISTVVFHDPLAAATIFDDHICQLTKGTATVELTSQQLLGYTHWLPDHFSGRHHIAASVDPNRFFDHFFSVFD